MLAASATPGVIVKAIRKAALSNRSGKRKVDEYVRDGDFWAEQFEEQLRQGSRETALLVLAERSR